MALIFNYNVIMYDRLYTKDIMALNIFLYFNNKYSQHRNLLNIQLYDMHIIIFYITRIVYWLDLEILYAYFLLLFIINCI